MSYGLSEELLGVAKQIELLIFDVDGVLTDGQVYFDDSQSFKAFNSRDGLGMVMAKKAGIEIALISGQNCSAVNRRFAKFDIKHLYQGVEDKRLKFYDIISDLSIKPESVAYLGDDLIDLPVMNIVGMPCAVSDADLFVQKQARWISSFNGGRGAAREFCEMILDAKGLLDGLRQDYLKY